jgi:hypothetical protein
MKVVVGPAATAGDSWGFHRLKRSDGLKNQPRILSGPLSVVIIIGGMSL